MDAPPRRVWPVVLAVQLGVLLAALDATIVGTGMPTIIAALGGVALYPWVFSAYMLASTAVMPVFGGLSEMGHVFWVGTGATVLGLGATLFLPRATPVAVEGLPQS